MLVWGGTGLAKKSICVFLCLPNGETWANVLANPVIISGPGLEAGVFASVSHWLKPRWFSLPSSVFSPFCRTWICGASPSSALSTPTASSWTSRTLSAISGKMQSCSWPSMTRTSPSSSGSGDPGHLPSTLWKYPTFTYPPPWGFLCWVWEGKMEKKGRISRQWTVNPVGQLCFSEWPLKLQ